MTSSSPVSFQSDGHHPQKTVFIVAGALSGAIGVGLGAFGAHGLKQILSTEMISTFETAVRYQMYHAFALIGVGLASHVVTAEGERTLRAAGWCFIIGSFFFSGSLYFLAILDVRWLGAVTPLGGILFVAGWGLFAWGVFRTKVL